MADISPAMFIYMDASMYVVGRELDLTRAEVFHWTQVCVAGAGLGEAVPLCCWSQ